MCSCVCASTLSCVSSVMLVAKLYSARARRLFHSLNSWFTLRIHRAPAASSVTPLTSWSLSADRHHHRHRHHGNNTSCGLHFLWPSQSLIINKEITLPVAFSITDYKQRNNNTLYNITLLPSVIARGMFCGAMYTHHTFTTIIKHFLWPSLSLIINKQRNNNTSCGLLHH